MIEVMRALNTILLTSVFMLHGCDAGRAEPARKMGPAQPAPRLEATIELPGGDGRVHVIVVPTDPFESARCIVAVGPSGNASSACSRSAIDAAPDPAP